MSNKNNSDVLKGLTKSQWDSIEKNLNKTELTVLRSLMEYAKGGVLQETERLRVVGDALYIEIRQILKELIGDSSSRSISTDLKKIKKIDQMRLSNALKNLKTSIKSSVASFNWKDLTLLSINSDTPLEIVGVLIFMYSGTFMLKNQDIYKQDAFSKEVWSLQVSLQRFIDAIEPYEGDDMTNTANRARVSGTFIADMKALYARLSKVFPFKGIEVSEKFPDLLVWAPLDRFIPSQKIQARNHQKRVIDSLDGNPVCVVYPAMLGSGKTTLAPALAEIAKRQGRILIFVCTIQTVREQTLRNLYNTNVNFADAYVRHDGRVKISRSHSSDKDKVIGAIVCGPEVAIRLLSEGHDEYTKEITPSKKFMLFLDEFTVGADDEKSKYLEQNVKLMMLAPEVTILSSATSPTLLELESNVLGVLRKKYDGLKVSLVSDPTVYVPIDVRDENGTLFEVYSFAKTSEDVQSVSKLIADMPFLGRTLTSNVLLTLYRSLVTIGAKGLPEIPILFNNVANLKPDRMRELVVEMLQILSTMPAEAIEKVCSHSSREITPSSPPKLSISEFGWRDYLGMTLVVDTDPSGFAVESFRGHLKNTFAKPSSSVILKYLTSLEEWKKHLENALKKCKSDDKKTDLQKEFDDKKPTLDFPESKQIGTKAWYIQNRLDHLRAKDVRNSVSAEAIVTRTFNRDKQVISFLDAMKDVSDDLITLLLCGVLVYSPRHLPLDYTNLVLEMASSGSCAYLFADEDIAFGTNFPFSRVIPTDRFTDEHSINVLFQLMGRAGRGLGKSCRARADLSSNTIKVLKEYVKNPSGFSIESENMTKTIKRLESDNKVSVERYISSVLEKKSTDDVVFSYDSSSDDDLEEDEKVCKIVPLKQMAESVFDHWEDIKVPEPEPEINERPLPVLPIERVIERCIEDKRVDVPVQTWRKSFTSEQVNKPACVKDPVANVPPKYVPPFRAKGRGGSRW